MQLLVSYDASEEFFKPPFARARFISFFFLFLISKQFPCVRLK